MDDRFRISDADRDRAAALLRDHFAAGRLTPSELDERLTAALAAKTFGDLRLVLADLPGPVPVLHQAGRFSPQASVVRRRGWIALALACVCVIGALGYALAAPQVYTATAVVYVTPTGGIHLLPVYTPTGARQGSQPLPSISGPTGARQGSQLLPSISGGVNLDNQAQVVKSGAVMSIAVRLLHSKLTRAALDQEISVTVRPDSQVLDISCRAPTGEGAVACANAVATAYLQNRRAAAAAAFNQQLQRLNSQISALQKTVAVLNVAVSHLPAYSPQRAAAQAQLASVQAQLGTLNAQVVTLYSQKADSSGEYIISRATTSRSSA